MSIYYISATGPTGDGSTPDKPFNSLAHLAATVTRTRDNGGDISAILFERGSVFNSGIGYWLHNNVKFGAFGQGERPIFNCPQFINTLDTPVNNLSIESLDIRRAATAVAPEANGFQLLSGGQSLRIVDCVIRGFAVNINVQGYKAPWKVVTVRDNVILDATAAGGRAQGVYMENAHDIALSGNIFDKCGTVQGIQSHGAYIHALCTDFKAFNNVFSRCAGTGLQARAGGQISSNIFIRCPVGLTFGYVLGGSAPTPGGVFGEVEDNVIFEGCDIGTPVGPQYLGARGIGMQIGNLQKDCVFQHNLIAKTASVVMWEPAVQFWQNHGTGLQNAVFIDNLIVDWNEVQFLSGAGMPPEFRFEDNTVHRIRFPKSPICMRTFVDQEYIAQVYARNTIIEPPKTMQYIQVAFSDWGGLRSRYYEPDWLRKYIQECYGFLPVPVEEPVPVPEVATFTVPAGTKQVVINIEQ